ncbi:MAG: hypothetical protein LBC42_01190, partial [Puniceicoccales bacterium]|nr:hypothetical protein [Puniceicoccales bacterium]
RSAKLVIARDVRYFSEHFAQLVADMWTRLGGEAILFPGPRSTPQLSFTVRDLGAAAGVMITASHNAFTDNGLKAFFADGAQVLDPHASAIMHHFSKISVDEACELLADLKKTPRKRVTEKTKILSTAADDCYLEALCEIPANPTIFSSLTAPIIYTPLHGTAIVIVERLKERFSLPLHIVECQRKFDPHFSTVHSPNPENHEAFSIGLSVADELHAEMALASDPDGDRLAIAHRTVAGPMRILTGNETAIFLAAYRLEALRARGILNGANGKNAAIIRSFVTTPLLDLLAAEYAVKLVQTPIGFKWIGAKLGDYERKACKQWQLQTGKGVKYHGLNWEKCQKLQLAYGCYLVLGAEESGGYSALDMTRDKDSHSALLMACEAYASLRNCHCTIEHFFEEIYRKYGYHGERLHTVQCPGAEGARKIVTFSQSLRLHPYAKFANLAVLKHEDYACDDLFDVDGKKIPPQNFQVFTLEGGYRVAVRASGTEPKIKFYLFAREQDKNLQAAKRRVAENFDRMEQFVDDDFQKRAANIEV